LCRGRGSELQLDKRYLRKDGQVVCVHEAFAAVTDVSGKFSYAIGMVEDVTEQQQAEQRARQHQEHLAHVLRVITMGEMAAQLAHEVNQPLGAMVNYANGALARLRERNVEPEILKAIAQIAAEGLRAGEVMRRVRDFVRQSQPQRAPSDLNYLVKQASLLIEPDARHHAIPLRLVLDPRIPVLEIDGIQIEQVVLNLLRNGLEAMTSSQGNHDHELLVKTACTDGSEVEVTVRDTGIGLPPDGAARIYDPFFTTKPRGLGMGLSISRSIVEAHGGRLRAMLNADRGTSFTFSLPLSNAVHA
jgi:C4-dicarboxylate-specific signal transduction histidine kinase